MFSRDRLTLTLEFGARILFAALVFAYFLDLPVTGWIASLPGMVAALVGYLVIQGLLYARALYGRMLAVEGDGWVTLLAVAVDVVAVGSTLVYDPYAVPPTLVLVLIAALNIGLRAGWTGFAVALPAAAALVAAAMAARGWYVDVADAHAIDFPLVFMFAGLLYFGLLAFRRSTLAAAAARYADQDVETQLLNRRGFDNAAGYLVPLHQRTQLPLVIMLASLDRRDMQPLVARERAAAVRRFADAVRQRARRSDVVARLSDDEFVFMLFDTPPAGAETLARSLLDVFAHSAGGSEARLTFGMIAMPEDLVAIDQLIARAKSSVLRAQKHPSSPSVVSAPAL